MATKVKNRQAAQNRLKAYSHPLRAAIFTVLTERTASPSELAIELGLPKDQIPSIDHHVKRLVKLGCAELVEESRGVGSLTLKRYKATERAQVETAEWNELLEKNPGLAKHHLGQFMQVQLDDYTEAIEAGTLGRDEDFHITRTRRVFDAKAMVESMEAHEQFCLVLDEIELRSAERRREDGTDAVHVSSGLFLIKVPPPTKESSSA